MLDPWCGSDDICLCNCLAFNGVPCRKSHDSFHSMSMVSYDLDTHKWKELDTTREIIWDTDRKGNHFIFDAQVVYKDSFGKSTNVPLRIMADTGATCSVFDRDFVEKYEIPWRR